MADQEGAGFRDPRAPSELFRSATATPALDLAAALDGLDRATRSFARRLGESRNVEIDGEFVPTSSRWLGSSPESTESPAAGAGPGPVQPDEARISAQGAVDQHMLRAEREARAHLEHAKRRADRLVSTMIGSVELEASEMRREAAAGVRARWQEAEAEAERQVAEARRIAESMVAERQRRIAGLSDGITRRAQALTRGMDDADRVRTQFDSFVRALSAAADQIAGDLASNPEPRDEGSHDGQDRPSWIAA